MRAIKYTIIIVAIVAVVIASNEFFSIFPRFKLKGIFNRKPILLESPVVIKEIKKIGELITGEFYGETFSDLDEVYTSLVKKYGDTSEYVRINLSRRYPDFESFYKKNEKILNQELKREELKKEIAKTQKEFENKQLDFSSLDSSSSKEIAQLNKTADKLLEEIRGYKDERKKAKKLFGRDDKPKIEALDKSIKEASEKMDKAQEEMKKIRKNLEEEKNSFEKDKKIYERNKDEVEKKLAALEGEIEVGKRKLIYIGRGWVKAGYKLDSLKEENVKITTKGDSTLLYLTLEKPIILNADINPWFIENEIEGYEIFRNEKAGLDFTQDEVTAVKVNCRENLIKEALKNGLMKKAQLSGEQTLTRFFKLLGFTEVYVNYTDDKTNIAAK